MNLQHVLIRKKELAAGTTEQPEVTLFVETNTKRIHIDFSRLDSKQISWMKWVGGAIVA